MIRGEVPGYFSRARCKTISTSSSVIAVRNSQCNRKREQPSRTGDGHPITIQHHEGQPAVALQRELVMKVDNCHLFPRFQPMIARHKSVMLVGFAVTITPGVKLTPAQANPGHKLQGS